MGIKGKHIYHSYAFLFCCFVLLYSLVDNPFTFNYEIEPDGCYLLFSISSVSLLLICLTNMIRSVYHTENLVCGNVVIGLLATTCIFLINPVLLSNEHVIVLFSMLIIYYCARISPVIIKWILPMLLIFWLIELSISIGQSWHAGIGFPLSVIGTLHNSGILACYLVIHIPLLYFYLFQRRTLLSLSFRRVIFLFLTGGVFFVVCRTQSRTAIISLLVTSFLLWYFNKAPSIRESLRRLPKTIIWVAITLSILIMALFSVWIFYLKEPSAIGRTIMAVITIGHFWDHFWMGVGLGRFTWFYPQWQSIYFEQHRNVTLKYWLTIDETYLIFNEYLQIFKEAGFSGLSLFITGLYYFFTRRSTLQDLPLLNTAKITVISIFSAGFTSYPFHVSSFLFILAICFAVVSTIKVNNIAWDQRVLKVIRPLLRPVLAILIFCAAYLSFLSVRLHVAERMWAELNDNYSISRPTAIINYDAVYNILRYDGKFLTEYGEFLEQDSSSCSQAPKILEEAKEYFISERTVLATAIAYKQTGNYRKSIENFKWLTNYLPGRFLPKYELLKLYRESGDIANEKILGNIILTMPVKFPSPEVVRIKQDTRQLLNQL